jgi:hypothetical protein
LVSIIASPPPSVLFVFRIRRRRNLLRSFSNIVGEKPDLENIVTGDATWTFQYDADTKCRSPQLKIWSL